MKATNYRIQFLPALTSFLFIGVLSANSQALKVTPNADAGASLNIYDLQGKQLMQIPITQRGENLHVISGHHFSAGMYFH